MRDFCDEDQALLRDLVLDGLRERWGDSFDPRFNSDLDDVATTYVHKGAEVVVVEADGTIIATGALLPEPGDRGRIVRMSVALGHRRQRLARQVVEELIARARRRGMTEVRVSTDTPWSSAVALYRSCGFTELGHDDSETHFAMTLEGGRMPPTADARSH